MDITPGTSIELDIKVDDDEDAGDIDEVTLCTKTHTMSVKVNEKTFT